ncbi:MAG: helix-turn-helix transcriptional regulator [Ekhidna sp.]|nr:helix-turn-helix transcriptional regulator [Ekhidna sp.]
MSTFSKRVKEQREELGLSQTKLAEEVGVHHSIIGRYERDEAKPTIDVVSRMAIVLKTTVGYLLGESEQADLFKDPEMLKRFKDILSFPKQKQEHILFALDSMIKATKLESL